MPTLGQHAQDHAFRMFNDCHSHGRRACRRRPARVAECRRLGINPRSDHGQTILNVSSQAPEPQRELGVRVGATGFEPVTPRLKDTPLLSAAAVAYLRISHFPSLLVSA